MLVKMFKAKKQTKRFNKNQKVWVSLECANHLYIYYKYRGKGRYIRGVISKWNSNDDGISKIIGENGIKEIEVSNKFAEKIALN